MNNRTEWLELADLAVNSGILRFSWAAVESLHNGVVLFQEPSSVLSLKYNIDRQPSCTIISFVTLTISAEEEHLQGGGDLVSSEDSNAENFPHFDFLCSQNNPSISISRYAVDLFKAHYDELLKLKSEIYDSQTARLSLDRPLIIAGHSLGGSIASLFTLWLLDDINRVPQKKNEVEPPKLPFCITFGAPLLGDKGLQGDILERPGWNSCFLHVVGNQDPLPKHFFCCHQAVASTYKPFGIFFLCSESGRICVEHPEAVSELLRSTSSLTGQWESRIEYYRHLVDRMESGFLIRGSSQLGSSGTSPGLILQLEAFGIVMSQHQNIPVGTLVKDLEKLELELELKRELDRKKDMDRNKKLNDIKKKMAHLEWYKKACATRSIGYYDSYKNRPFKQDMDVTRLKKALTNYWKTIVEDAERMPQKEPARIRGAWLYAGMNYRRMVEPLDIAEYYKENAKGDYLTGQNRSNHYILLEKWQLDELEKPRGPPNENKKNNVANLLTEDSCFWARVERALLACELLRGENTGTSEKESSTKYLDDFEKYVMDQINKYAVSPEIFFADCSFMKWWRQFQEIIDTSHNTQLVQFMRIDGPEQYKMGKF